MKNGTFNKISRIAGLFMIFLLAIMYGCDQSSNPISSSEMENSEMDDLQISSHVTGNGIRITTSETATHINPAIDGERIVWQDDRNSNFDIFLYDLSSSSESQITDDPSDQVEPAIDGTKIVWSDNRSLGTEDIFMYDLESSTETQITDTDAPYDEAMPEISGDRIIYFSWRFQLFVHDLNTMEDIPVGFFNSPKSGYDISGDLVVMSEFPGYFRIYNLDTEVFIWEKLDLDISRINPSIEGNRVVWQDDRNGNYDIYFYDVSTDTETQITSNSSDQTHPVISGDYIVWVDNRDGNENIYYYDLVNKTEHQVTDNSASQVNPDISGNRIVWEDNRDGNWNIYYHEIKSEKSSDSGFTNGSGFIHSPEGAVVNDGSVSGRAKFGLNARLQKGDLKGKATFRFDAGNIDFQSTSYQQIVVSGNTAQISGAGTINGGGAYDFYISVVDEKSTGKNKEPDKYRIRIEDSVTKEVVYDNQMGDSTEGKATHPITNGNILVKSDK